MAYRVRDAEAQADIARLVKSEAFNRLLDEVKTARAKFYANMADGLMRSLRPVDQREVDEKRGFWKGALWALETLPNTASSDWDKHVEDALKESETLGR